MTKRAIFHVLLGMTAGILLTSAAHAEDLLYTDAQADCAAQMIFMNECSGKEKNLLYWSPHEAFPSLGIGHFIWYPQGTSGPYLESFPGYLEFANEMGLAVPAWVKDLPTPSAPWRTRKEFERDLQSERVKELRVFLRDTKRAQAQYIIRRFQRIFPTILEDIDEAEREIVKSKYDLLMGRPAGAFAMIDYVNFKGEGLRRDARYQGEGWGLAQVLLEMKVPDSPDKALDEFISAAERVLERRVKRSSRPEVEAHWLPGWKKRLQGYARIDCQ